MTEAQRAEVWALLTQYREHLRRENQFDWAEVPLLTLEGMNQGRIPLAQYHAILVDEAQDFAPSWFAVVQRMLKPSTNMLFLVADAAQKIYRRSISWRTLAIDVTGNRSRILNRSYRNTYEILRVAYELINDDQTLRQQLQAEGEEIISPDLDSSRMRRGPMPIVLQFDDPSREVDHIAQEIRQLHASGYSYHDIAIIQKEWRALHITADRLEQVGIPVRMMKGPATDGPSPAVRLITVHGSKGLEFSVVFVVGVDRLQPRAGLSGDELALAIAEERRLLYVALTRARHRLYISHTGPPPIWAAAALALAERVYTG
jgi:superfamily I DNA/RNA helicase